MRRKLRYTTASVLTTALVLTASSCGGDEEDEPQADPTPTATSTPPPTMDPSAWTNKYNEKLVAQFDEALDRFTTYEKRIEPYWRTGKATEKAKKIMEEYWYFPQWEDEYELLKTYERSKIQRKGLAEVLWSKPTRLKQRAVIIRQCVDPSPIEVVQKGKPAKGALQQPFIRTIHMSKPKGYEFLISDVKGVTNKKKVKRCSA